MNAKIIHVLLIALPVALAGCGSDPPPPPPAKPAAPVKPGARPGAPAAPGASAVASADLTPPPPRDISEKDFSESPSNRDPFRSYEAEFKAQNAPKKVIVQREVLANKYALEELKIVGIVNGGAGRVLMDDPTGLGWVLKVGDFVGKPEVVHSGGTTGADVSVNWRVDRIRENDVVFVREDPTRPDVPSTTRVLSMRTPEELNPEIRTGVRSAPTSTSPEPISLPGTPPPKG